MRARLARSVALRAATRGAHVALCARALHRGDADAGAGASEERARETLETAERDELGLLVLQRDIIRAQDEQLEDLSRVVTSTRHIALAVNEELGLQSRLLVCVWPRLRAGASRLVTQRACMPRTRLRTTWRTRRGESS